MIVYVVEFYDYNAPQIFGVFSTSEQAEAFVAASSDRHDLDISVHKIDDPDWEEAEPETPK